MYQNFYVALLSFWYQYFYIGEYILYAMHSYEVYTVYSVHILNNIITNVNSSHHCIALLAQTLSL